MPSLIILSLILPLMGAVAVLGLSLVSRLRPYACYLALALVLVTAVLILTLGREGPIEEAPLSWQPSHLLGVTPVLQSDVAAQSLALALTLATGCAILVELSLMEEASPRHLAALLALLAPCFVSLWAASPLAAIIGWAAYDLLQAAERVAAGGSVRTTVRGLAFGLLATMLLWLGALLPGATRGSSALWLLMSPSAAQMTLWTAACLLRVWGYPFHLSIPDDPGLSSLILSPAIGWGLFIRLVSINDGLLPGASWAPPLAAATMAVGGFLAWSCKTPRSVLSWIEMESAGAILLVASLVGEGAVGVIVAGSVTWVLAVTALALTGGLQREAPWWSIPAAVGAWALLGAPVTLGFLPQAALLGLLAEEALLGLGIAFFLGNLFLIPALGRWLLSSPASPLPDNVWSLAGRVIGTGLPALLLVAAGLLPSLLVGVPSLTLAQSFALPGLAGWLLWAVSLTCGGVLAWQDRNVRPRIELPLDLAHSLVRLDWLYGAAARALERGLSLLRAADEVVSGAGALLWSWVLFLLILLVWGSL